ncbi:MAG: hypothetical protein IJI88_01385 [Atopobiaceae bacterium]|nr:hypothetical protein [Kiritimatiellia bacterium]MBQ6490908.1 hypothetical protein [Atopobiaceae bacterium]
MPSIIAEAAQAVADSIATPPEAPSARWRWGTVVAVNADGTMDVDIAGAELQGIRCMEAAMGASAGDRVRIAYLGTESVVDGIRATVGDSTTVSDIITSASGFTCTVASFAVAGGSAQVDLTFSHTSNLSANTQYTMGTLKAGHRPKVAAYGGLIMNQSEYGNVVVSTSGDVYYRPSASVSSSTPVRCGATFILA